MANESFNLQSAVADFLNEPYDNFKESVKNINDELHSSRKTFDILSQKFTVLSDLDLDNDSQFVFKEFEEHFDSDESLGILPSHLIDDKTSEDGFILDKLITETNKFQLDKYNDDILVGEGSIFPFVENYSEQESLTKLNMVINDNALKAVNDSLTGHVAPAMFKASTQLSEEKRDLNVTFQNHTIKEFKIVEGKNSTDEVFLPAYSMPKGLFPRWDESPIESTTHSPKYCSTPKSEANFDEKYSNYEQKFSPVSHLNETIVKKAFIKEENTGFDQSNKLSCVNVLSDMMLYNAANDEKNSDNSICNITHNIDKLLNSHESELNKTFNVINDAVTYPKELENKNKTFDLKENENIPHEFEVSVSEDKRNVKCQYEESIQINVLNTTIRLPDDLKNKFDTFNLGGCVDSNTQVSFVEKLECQDFKTVSGNMLNTTFSMSDSEAFDLDEKKNANHTTQLLNTMYEKMDELDELPKIVKSPKAQKQCIIKQTGNAKTSRIARRIDSVSPSSAPSSSKYSELNKKKIRKSCVPRSNDFREELNKQNKNRRQTFENISSETDAGIALSQNHKRPSKIAQKRLIYQTTDLKSLRTSSSLSHDDGMIKICPIKGKVSTESVKNKQSLVNSMANTTVTSNDPPSSMPEISSRKTGKTKLSIENKLKHKQDFLLNETINLTHSVPIAKKVVMKKPNIPPKGISSVKEKISKLKTTYCGKSFLPKVLGIKQISQSACVSPLEAQEKTFMVSRTQERELFLQENEANSVPSSSTTKQNLGRKSSASGAAFESCLFKNRSVPGKSKIPSSSASKKKDTEETHNVKIAGSEKRIPTRHNLR